MLQWRQGPDLCNTGRTEKIWSVQLLITCQMENLLTVHLDKSQREKSNEKEANKNPRKGRGKFCEIDL